MKKNSFILILLAMVTILGGCTSGSYYVKNASELNTSTKMSMIYEELNGHKQTQIQVKENEPVVVTVNIVTESGTIDAYIAKGNDTANCEYQGRDIQTSSFTVTLSEKGSYTIRVDAKDHSGSYNFSWEK